MATSIRKILLEGPKSEFYARFRSDSLEKPDPSQTPDPDQQLWNV